MINLLPPTEKKRVSDEKRKRVILILLFFLVVFLVLASGVIYTTKRYGLEVLSSEIEAFKRAKTELATVDKESEDIKEFNQILNHISQVNEDSIEVGQLYSVVESKIPAGVKIEKLSLARLADGYQAILSGNASKWEELTVLEKNLSQFSEVNFSSDSWKQVENIDFLVKFVINE